MEDMEEELEDIALGFFLGGGGDEAHVSQR